MAQEITAGKSLEKKSIPSAGEILDNMHDQIMTSVEKYAVLDLIGKGHFAKVYLCRHQITDMEYAMKIVEKTQLRKEAEKKHMRLEIAISKLLRHPHVVSMHHVMETGSHIYIVQDFISGGSLQTLLQKRGKLPELEAKRYMLQLLDGLGYCHSRGACHRDLKPENLLLEGDSIKITDFGFANYIGNDEEEEESNALFTRCGSPLYVAPEVILATDTSGYDGRKADIWSCGVILYEMLTGTRPFRAHDYRALYRLITNCQYVDAGLPRDAAALIRQLLCPASDRLTLAQIGAHPWFNGAKSPVYPRKCLKVTEAGIANAIDTIEPSVDRQTSTAKAYRCDNVEIRHNKLIGSSTMWSNARVTIVDDVLHVVVLGLGLMHNREVRSPPFPLPLTRIFAIKLRKRGDKILIKIELRKLKNVQPKGPKKLIFVFHGTSKDDHSAAMRLHKKLHENLFKTTRKFPLDI